MTDELLTVDEVAPLLRRSPAALRWLIHKNEIPSALIGGRRLFRRSDIEAYISNAFEKASA